MVLTVRLELILTPDMLQSPRRAPGVRQSQSLTAVTMQAPPSSPPTKLPVASRPWNPDWILKLRVLGSGRERRPLRKQSERGWPSRGSALCWARPQQAPMPRRAAGGRGRRLGPAGVV